ncbi:MAG: peptidoglycan-binding protein, partial [Patescibacteria group bacterium]|nr:peptidoglycan-binding protein [Patescibacteria group bacterium]
MSIAQKSLAFIAVAAVAVAVVFSFVATLEVASAATVTGCPHTWNVNLKVGSRGPDVLALQQLLNSDAATVVASSGAGSPGMETSYYGKLTAKAVSKFQEKYATSVLTPLGLSAGTGYFGAASRAEANAICAGTVTPTPTPTPTPSAGTGVSVSAGTQPANSLAPKGASRVPFTTFNLTAGNDGDVTVNGVTVQRTGLGSDAAFQGVILVDQDTGMQVGTSKTFNSNHQATIGGTFVIPKGTTKHYLVAGNMQSDLSTYSGQAPSIAVVAINTTANVSGSLPITGASQTLNNTLTVGTLTLDTSNAFAVNASTNQNIGTTGYRFTGFRLTAGSAEDVRLRSVTWNQTGSVSATDLANVVTVVNGTSYPTTLSSDGKYYYSSLGAGVVIPKGNSVDVYVQGDIVGSNASGRSVIFDVDKNTDIFATGETYGYGISPVAPTNVAVPTTRGNLTVTSGSPYVYASQVTVTGAAVTTIAKASEVPAQNIAVNVPNQPLGGFAVDLRGEGMSVQSMKFTVATSSGAGLLTNVTLVDENGSVVAGPVDEAANGTITFTDTVTFHTGRHVYTVRGKVPSGVATGVTYQLSTNPSTDWTNVKGETSGNSISLSGLGSFTMNTMTVRAGSVAVGVSSSPASQTIVPGGSQVLLANFQFDASQSGEDIRLSSIPVTLTFGGFANKNDLTSCQFYNGTQALNSGSNVLQPSNATATTSPYSTTVVLDNPQTITKGTVLTLGLRCNVSGSAINGSTYSFAPQTASNFTFTGVNSGTTVTGTNASSPTITVTIGAGAATVTGDSSAPGYTLASATSVNVPVNALRFAATNEDVNLTKIGLQLNTASSSAADIAKVSIWDGATKVGEAYFTGSQTTATSTLFNNGVVIPKNGNKILKLTVDLNDVGTGLPVPFSGHLV